MNPFPELQRHWFILCQSKQLGPRPLQRAVLDTPLVVFRTAEGKAAALLDRCPHRNAPLSSGWVQGQRLTCPYHGWQFDEEGVCRVVPGLCGQAEHQARNVAAYSVVEQDGFVWACLGTPSVPQPRPFAHLPEPGYAHFIGETVMVGALPDVLENFLDGTHTHFVHSGLIRTEGQRKDITVIVRLGADNAEAEYLGEGQQTGLISRLFGAGIDGVFGRFCLPSLAQLEYRAQGQLKMLITLCFTPETETRQRLFAVVVGHAPRWVGLLAAPVLKLLFGQALHQDRHIVELQTATVKRFGGAQYVYTELDVLGPHILRLLKHGPTPGVTLVEKRVQMRL